MINPFYNKLIKNLDLKKTFYKNGNHKFLYSDLKFFFYKFLNITKYLPKKRNKICILSDKCFELYASSLSTILSNNIWIPLSTNFPEKRIFDIVNIVKPDLFIIDQLNLKKNLKIKNFLKKRKIKLITFKEINKCSRINKIPKIEYLKNDISMIFFTSGSTGLPKGVKISHGSYIHSLCEQIKKLFKNKKNLVFGDYHDISFVISLNILLPCFFLKGTIVPATKTKDVLFPIDHIIKNKINTLITVPTTINRIRSYYKINNKKNFLENLILCGEPFYYDLYSYLNKQNFSKNIFNCYGSTELSPWVFSFKLNNKKSNFYKSINIIPIGKKFNKVKTKIIDDILYVGGPTLSNGYLNSRENKNIFVNFSGTKYYKTNDIVEVKNGNYIVKGRSDNIVKISGIRVELFEIDTVIRKINSVKNCLIFIRQINKYDQFLCAAIESQFAKENIIIKHLKKKLPSYMLPKKIKIFKKFPLNKNFKVDRSKIKNLF